MDIAAFAQIERIKSIAEKNGIEIPRLRGYRLMLEEGAMPEDKLDEALKSYGEDVKKQYKTYNKYCGRADVLYIHARIGGANWDCYGGREIEKQLWFIERVDDGFDNTYCDIYARIKEA